MSTTEYQQILLERDGAVATITLNRPARLNAITMRLWDEFEDAMTTVAADPSVRCVIVTGSGQRGFCAGRDLDEQAFSEGRVLDEERLGRMQNVLIPTLVNMPKPVIAAVNGAAAGAGLAFALACDLRIASESARFTVAFLKVGFVPDAGAVFLLSRAVGYPKAFELCATSDLLDAREALRIGLVNRVVPADALLGEARALAARFAAMPPLALVETKRLLREGPPAGLERSLEMETQAQMRVMGSRDHQEGVAAFHERREPKFEGRSREP